MVFYIREEFLLLGDVCVYVREPLIEKFKGKVNRWDYYFVLWSFLRIHRYSATFYCYSFFQLGFDELVK